jgi:hypothetical protein
MMIEGLAAHGWSVAIPGYVALLFSVFRSRVRRIGRMVHGAVDKWGK